MESITYLDKYVCVITPSGCHECISHKKKDKGYSRVKIGLRFLSLHRLTYEAFNNPIPEGLMIRHKCDNRSCVNPSHLETGTAQDNINDMIQRNRQRVAAQIGEKNPRAKITEDIVRAIRNDKESSNTSLAKQYGVTHSMISAIRLYKNWKHVI